MTARHGANQLGVLETAEAIRTRKLRSIDVVDACLERIVLREDAVGHGPTSILRQRARRRWHAIACPRRDLLHGVPLGVKDIIDTVDMPTECGSAIYRGRRAASDAACVALARRAGAVILGKTVTTEFAYFAPGKTANPRDSRHTPGGSSSGTAAAVADEMVPAGFGTQTAASITRPASFCGVVGYKPSFNTFSLAGIKPFSESFDTLGTITRNAVDARYLRCALLDTSFRQLASMSHRALDYAGRHGGMTPIRTVGVSSRKSRESWLPQVRRFRMQHCPKQFFTLPDVHRLIMAYEAARSYAYEYDAHRGPLSPQLVELIEHRLRIARSDYEASCEEAGRARDEFAAWLRVFDLLLTPSAKGEAPRGLASTGDPLFSRLWTLLRVPSVTLPGLTGEHNLPIGVQLVGCPRGRRATSPLVRMVGSDSWRQA